MVVDLADCNELEGVEMVTGGREKKRASWVQWLLKVQAQWSGKQQRDVVNENIFPDQYCDDDNGEVPEVNTDEEVEENLSINRESFAKLLTPVAWADTKLFSKLAFLSNISKVLPEMKAYDLRRYYGLEFVTSSLIKKNKFDQDNTCVPGIISSPTESDSHNGDNSKKKHPSSRPSVAHKIAASAASYVQSRAKDLLSLISEQQQNVGDAALEDSTLEEDSCSPQVYKSEVAAYVEASTMTAAIAPGEKEKVEAARELHSFHSSPCECLFVMTRAYILASLSFRFFCCCAATKILSHCILGDTRLTDLVHRRGGEFVLRKVCETYDSTVHSFVLGSDPLSSWKAHLFFEPTKFEGTDVLVHRGIYEAAIQIYDQVMPHILQQLNIYDKQAKLQFTGHSLGGCISLLITLMLLSRKVVKPSALKTVVMFGSPFVFCEGQKILGLDENHVQCIIMHRDIVPRVFSCNYPDYAAQLLRRLHGSFRSHPCLNNNKLLYTPMGKVFILQPNEESSPPHPLLPPGSALYALENPQGGSRNNALVTFLNSPHPLETLSDPTAYGADGSILRDHDSSNYLKALNGVIRQNTEEVVRRVRKQRNLLWPILTTPYSHAWRQEHNAKESIISTKKDVEGSSS